MRYMGVYSKEKTVATRVTSSVSDPFINLDGICLCL